MSVKFCGQCGSQLEEGSTFCTNCGWKVVLPSGSVAPVQIAQSTQQGVFQQPPQPQVRQPVQTQYQQPSQPQYQPQPVKKKAGCGGCLLIAVLIIVLAVAAFFFGGQLIKPQLEKLGIDTSGFKLPEVKLPGVTLPMIGGGEYNAKALSGPYVNEFETLSATVNGVMDVAYAGMIGQKMTMNSIIKMTDDRSGTLTFSGGSYGTDINYAMPFAVKGDQLDIIYEDVATNSKLHYTGTLSKENDKVVITGTYETTYTDPTSSSVVVMSGNWKAYSAKGTVSKNLDTSMAKKDVTLDQMQGIWSGTIVYTKIENLEEMPDVTEEDKQLARDMIGRSMNLKMLFEGDVLTMTMQDPSGGESDLEDLPPVTLEDGVFTAALTMTEDEGTGNMNISGVVYEEGGQLKIKGELSMEMAFVQGKTITMIVELATTKE